MKLKSGAAMLALALTAASPAGAQVNVCIWGTITGPDALVNGMSYGVRDYLEFLNVTQGGIAGTKVTALLLDGRYKLDEELKIYRRCVDEEKAVVVNGWSTGSAKALREQVNSDGVPFMTQSFASEVLDPKKYPYIFMAGPTYEQQMAIAFRDLAAKGGKKVVIMAPDNEYGRGPVNVVRQSGIIKQLGLDLVDTVEFRYDAQDLTAQMLRVKSRNPDMVYIQASGPQAIAILRDAAKVGLPAKLFVGNLYTISPTIPEQLGEAAEGFRAIQAYEPYGADIPAMKQIEQFAAKGKVEKKDIYYMKGWMEGIAIAAAIENAIKKNGGHPAADIKQFRQDVRDQMEGLTALDDGGITPPLNFANHQGSTQALIAEVKNGKYVPTGEWINAHLSGVMLQVSDVEVHYDGAIVALQGVTFTVERGGLVALLGPNGAGKTTLMKAVAGMLPFELGEIVAGEITLEGASLKGAHPATITRRGLALVQDGRQCFRNLTIAENLRAASFLSPKTADAHLKMVFGYFPVLHEMQERPAGFLSGGQLQMLTIAMALMGNPKLLLLDELSLGLSPVMVQSVFDVVERMHRDLGMTVVVAEQTVPRLLKMATDLYVLSRGRVVMHAKPEEADEEALQRVYLS